MSVSRTRSGSARLILFLIVFLLLAAAAAFFLLRPQSEPLPALEETLSSLDAQCPEGLSGIDRSICKAAAAVYSVSPAGQPEQHYRRASGAALVTVLDEEALSDGIGADMQAILERLVADASRPAEVYSDVGTYLPSVTERAYAEAVENRLTHAEDYCRSFEIPVSLRYSGGSWKLDAPEALSAAVLAFPSSLPGYEAAAAAVEPVDFHYRLRDWTSPGPVPDPSCFGETTDPEVVLELLETETARWLIGGQRIDFDPADLLPGRTIYYYLDETILSLVWQEDEHGAIGTFAETFISDASQLRRKIADDTFRSLTYYFPTVLSRQANAVTAVSGDFYDHPDRIFGIYAYDGKVMLSSLTKGQTCFFTDAGDMLFTYEGQFETEEEAQTFMDDNHAMFSVSFGPVMVENGVDVTPYDYPLGEVRDTYARCAFGQLGKLHYLAMTINVEQPDHYVYVTLRQAADSMIAHGCINAYTLDGGQTGSIMIDSRLINPVQFGREREMSDIIYFATAIPND